MMLNYKLLGKRIKETRKLRKISQAKLAELTDLSVSYISHLENAKKKPSLQSFVSIALVMGITADTLLIGNQNNTPAEYQSEILILMQDCNSYEKKIIFDMVTALKKSLKESTNP